jgi:glutathione S-transferase
MRYLFEGSVLYITSRSPFARRVRIALLENGISYTEKTCDVFNPTADLFLMNPLGRVPVIKLSDDSILIDSNLILQVFYQSKESRYEQVSVRGQLEILRWSAIFVGLCEKVVEYYLNTLLPDNQRSSETAAELFEIAERCLKVAEKRLQERKSKFFLNEVFTQADIDLGVCLNYLDLRYPVLQWQERFRDISDYYMQLSQRQSFILTAPPLA